MSIGAMNKKKAKGKSAKKAKKTRSSTKKDPAKVREEIAGMVRSEARDITEAVMDEAKKGELAPAKYLLEMAGVYPPATDGTQATPEEDCLARTLLDRLNVPPRKVASEEEETASVAEPAPVEEKAEE
jgi:hypothetical protein